MNKAELIEKYEAEKTRLSKACKNPTLTQVSEAYYKGMLFKCEQFLTDLKELEEDKSEDEIEKLAQEYAGNYICPLNNGKAVTPYEHGAIKQIKQHFKAGAIASK